MPLRVDDARMMMSAVPSGVTPDEWNALALRFGEAHRAVEAARATGGRGGVTLLITHRFSTVAAADLAMADAAIPAGSLDPERFGVVVGGGMIYADIEDLELTYRRSIDDGRFNGQSSRDIALRAEMMVAQPYGSRPSSSASRVSTMA